MIVPARPFSQRSIFLSLGAGACAFFFYTSSFFSPFLGIFLSPFSSFPLFLIGFTQGLPALGIAGVFLCTLLGLVLGEGGGIVGLSHWIIVTLLTLFSMGQWGSHSQKTTTSFSRILSFGLVLSALFLALIYIFLGSFFSSETVSIGSHSSSKIVEVFNNVSGALPTQLDQIPLLEKLWPLFPAILTIGAWLTYGANLLLSLSSLSSPVLNHWIGKGLRSPLHLEECFLQEWWLWALGLSLTLWMGSWSGNFISEFWGRIGQNSALVVCMPLTISGLGAIKRFLLARGSTHAKFISFLLCLGMFFLPFLAFFVIVFGVLEYAGALVGTSTKDH